MPALRRQTLLILYIGLVLYLLTSYFLDFYFREYPLQHLLSVLRALLTTGFFLAAALGLGLALLRLLKLETPAPEEPFWALGLGGAVFSLGLLLLGLAGGFRPALILLLSAGSLVLTGPLLWKWARRNFPAKASSPRSLPLPEAFLLSTAIAATGLTALCALAPPTYYDSLVYHLALPAKYLQEGRIGFIPYNHYSHFPQNMEMIFAWFLAAGDDVSAQLFCVALAVLTGLFLFVLGRGPGKTRGFRWDILFFLSAPCVILLSSETYAEIGLAYWTTLALAAAARGFLSSDRRWLLLSGLMGGFAAGIKYTGVLTPALLALVLLAWPRAASWQKRAGDASAVGLPAFLVFLPWMMKNYFLTGGNPVFPFLPGLFPAARIYLPVESSQAYFRVLDEYKGTSPLLMELFSLPTRIASDAVSFGGGFDVTGDLGWVLPLFLFPLVFFYFKENPFQRFLAVYALLHLVLWASLRPVLRFLFPLFPVLSLLAGWGVSRWFSDLPARTRKAAGALLVAVCCSNAVLFYMVEEVRKPFPVAWGILGRELYLRKSLDFYHGMQFINAQLPPESRVLFVGDQRGYYCRRRYLAPMALLPSPLKAWTDQAKDAEALRKTLLEEGFTHIFFNQREAARLQAYAFLEMTEHGKTVWGELTRKLPRLYDSAQVTVYSLQ